MLGIIEGKSHGETDACIRTRVSYFLIILIMLSVFDFLYREHNKIGQEPKSSISMEGN